VADRATVKAALRAVLVKTHDHELAFDAVFDLYFAPQPSQSPQPPQAASPDSSQAPAPDDTAGQAGAAGPDGQRGGGGLRPLDHAILSELLLTALREGNEVMMRAIASLFVDRHAGIEPGRPVAGTYYVFRTMRAVDPDRLLTRLAGTPGQAAG